MNSVDPAVSIAFITIAIIFLLWAMFAENFGYKDFKIENIKVWHRVVFLIFGVVFFYISASVSGTIESVFSSHKTKSFKRFELAIEGFQLSQLGSPCEIQFKSDLTGKIFTVEPKLYKFGQAHDDGNVYIWRHENENPVHKHKSNTAFLKNPDLPDSYNSLRHACGYRATKD